MSKIIKMLMTLKLLKMDWKYLYRLKLFFYINNSDIFLSVIVLKGGEIGIQFFEKLADYSYIW